MSTTTFRFRFFFPCLPLGASRHYASTPVFHVSSLEPAARGTPGQRQPAPPQRPNPSDTAAWSRSSRNPLNPSCRGTDGSVIRMLTLTSRCSTFPSTSSDRCPRTASRIASRVRPVKRSRRLACHVVAVRACRCGPGAQSLVSPSGAPPLACLARRSASAPDLSRWSGVGAVLFAPLARAWDRLVRFCREDGMDMEYGNGRLSCRHPRWSAAAALTHCCPSTPWAVMAGRPSSWAMHSAIPSTPRLRHSASMRPSCLRPEYRQETFSTHGHTLASSGGSTCAWLGSVPSATCDTHGRNLPAT